MNAAATTAPAPPPPLDPQLQAARDSLHQAEQQLAEAPAQPTWWSTHNAMTICAVILVFGAVVIAIAAVSVRKQATNVDSMLRLVGTIMIITLAVFLVVAGYNDKQIAAPLGLLGTIAGYLLGREAGRDRATNDNAPSTRGSQGQPEQPPS